MRTSLLFAAALAVILQACSDGNASTANTDNKNNTMGADPGATSTSADRDFAQKAAMGGMAEVELGRMAASKGTAQKVKQFGEHMVADHGKANDELKRIAGAKNIDLPADLDAEHKSKKDQLDQLTGSDFDRAYVDAMVGDHEKTLELFQTEAADGADADLKAFATRTADVIQMHLTMIKEIQQEMM
jgi:putative membrane protein